MIREDVTDEEFRQECIRWLPVHGEDQRRKSSDDDEECTTPDSLDRLASRVWDFIFRESEVRTWKMMFVWRSIVADSTSTTRDLIQSGDQVILFVFNWLIGTARQVRVSLEFRARATEQKEMGRIERRMGHLNRVDLRIWLHRQDLSRSTTVNHILVRVKEFVIDEVMTLDVMCALLEVVFTCSEVFFFSSCVDPISLPSLFWSVVGESRQLNQVDLSEVFLQRVPLWKSCPRFLRSRLSLSFGVRYPSWDERVR